jgi:hypothetical protein
MFPGLPDELLEKAKENLEDLRDVALQDAKDEVEDWAEIININDALKPFDPQATSAFTSLEIRPESLILRGEITASKRLPEMVLPTELALEGTAVRALKSWIPGGTIDKFIWSWVSHEPSNAVLPWAGTEKKKTVLHSFLLGSKLGVKSVKSQDPQKSPAPAKSAPEIPPWELYQLCLRVEGTQVRWKSGPREYVWGFTTCESSNPSGWRSCRLDGTQYCSCPSGGRTQATVGRAVNNRSVVSHRLQFCLWLHRPPMRRTCSFNVRFCQVVMVIVPSALRVRTWHVVEPSRAVAGERRSARSTRSDVSASREKERLPIRNLYRGASKSCRRGTFLSRSETLKSCTSAEISSARSPSKPLTSTWPRAKAVCAVKYPALIGPRLFAGMPAETWQKSRIHRTTGTARVTADGPRRTCCSRCRSSDLKTHAVAAEATLSQDETTDQLFQHLIDGLQTALVSVQALRRHVRAVDMEDGARATGGLQQALAALSALRARGLGKAQE